MRFIFSALTTFILVPWVQAQAELQGVAACRQFPLDIQAVEAAADAGDAYCQAVLGAAAWRGIGVKRDLDRALLWSRRAWEADHPLGHYNHGYFLSNERGIPTDAEAAMTSYALARQRLQVSATEDVNAAFAIGVILRGGLDGTDRDLESACEWFRAAAERGHPLGMHELAQCHRYQRMPSAAPAEAVNWYRQAVQAGSMHSAWQLGTLYESEGNLAAADKLYLAAADMGHPNYELQWAQKIEAGLTEAPFERNLEMALTYYLRAGANGEPEGHYRAAMMLFAGAPELAQDRERARLLFQRAAAKDHAEAIRVLASNFAD